MRMILLLTVLFSFAVNATESGDTSIRRYLAKQAALLEHDFLKDVKTSADFEQRRAGWRQDYFEMLGLWPLPEKTPLNAVVTGTLEQPGFKVEKLHFQSRPGLYVTGNLYLPNPLPKEKLPAILYQCGHANMKRDGNKSAYQDQGIWFATHGYVCLAIDSLQLGEIAGIHHGTYREGRWWWHSAGYTPAGVECWNGIRALDYLQSRGEVDPERLGATGISGGGAATFWISAADERIKASAPCAAMADLQYYVGEDGVNGHCDCMFLYNRARWNWTQIAALICPRPLLFANSDADPIFPLPANDRVINRLEWLYARFGVGDKVGAVISVGGHAYRTDLRRAIFEFFNRTLKQDARPVTDPDSALVEPDGPTTSTATRKLRIPTESLRVFPTDADFPKDMINAQIDQTFVPVTKVEAPQAAAFESWRRDLTEKLKRNCFGAWPEPTASQTAPESKSGAEVTEDGIEVQQTLIPGKDPAANWLIVLNPDEDVSQVPAWAKPIVGDGSALLVATRGMGPSAWTRKNPPNTIERSLALLGQTVDSGRVYDIRTVLQRRADKKWNVAGKGNMGVLAAYAAMFVPEVASVTLVSPPASHKPDGPAFLNVLRVCDIPEALGALAPRPLTIVGAPELQARVELFYKAAGASERLRFMAP